MPSMQQQVQNAFRAWANNAAARKSESSILARLEMSTVLKLLTRLVGQAIPFATRNGFEVVDLGEGAIKCRMPFKPNKNHFNAMYAGALFTVAELPGGILSLLNFDERMYPVLVEFNIKYLKPAKTDVTVEFRLSKAEMARIEREAETQGKSAFDLESEIHDADGEVVAKTLGKYKVLMK